MAPAQWSLLLSFTAFFGCPIYRPTDATLNRIERRLGQDACIGDLKNWSRTYSYAQQSEKWSTDLVEFRFVRPGNDGARPGRFIDQKRSASLDDRNYELVYGSYKISTDELDVWACGWNAGPGRHGIPKLRIE